MPEGREEPEPMKVLLAHPGTQTSFRLAAELHRASALSAYYTGFAISQGTAMDRFARLLPTGWSRRLGNRTLRDVPPRKVHIRPLLEAWAVARMSRGRDHQTILHRRNVSFQRSIPDRALRAADLVIGFDTSSEILARRCADFGVPFLLDQTHPDVGLAGVEEIRKRYPDWAEQAETRLPEVYQAEKEERRLATLIAVASSFSRRSLIDAGVQADKVRVNPLGVDIDRFTFRTAPNTGRLRFLFVGALTARKGIPLLLDAWRQLRTNEAELWLAGPASTATLSLLPELPGMRYLGQVPPQELASVFRQSDVFVFPSYCEGFGQVILEAMASGLPVITTTATAGPDIITPKKDGWIIERDSPGELVETMQSCLSDPAAVRQMAEGARATAEGFSWGAYRIRLIELASAVANRS